MQTGTMFAYFHLDTGAEIGPKVRCLSPRLIHYHVTHVIPGFVIIEMKNVESSATYKRCNLPVAKALNRTYGEKHSTPFIRCK